MKANVCLSLAISAVALSSVCTLAEDAEWSRFRGPNGSGVSVESENLPVQWSDTKNLKWKVDLPGPGSSCPIVVGDRIFLTSWSGYADGKTDGSLQQLKRHLVCLDRETGKQLWATTAAAVQPEDSYRGMFAENGYASHTPVSDGKYVFAFFGKSGVHAYDMQGNLLWKANVGEDRDRRGWGSASSPILYKNLVIVTAAVESQSLVALDKETGKEVWKQQADGFASTWGTPVLVDTGERTELVIGVPYEIWSLNPDTGKLLWYCESLGTNSMCASLVAHEGVVYCIESGSSGGGAIAVRAGGKGDVTATHVVWKEQHRSRIGTPVIHDGHIYFVNSGVASCIDLKTGKRIYQSRLDGGTSSDDSRGRSFGGRSGRGGGQDYSSPVAADGKLYYARRSGDIFVVKLGDKFEQLATNRFDSSSGDFHATPAISGGELFIRSSAQLYCVAEAN